MSINETIWVVLFNSNNCRLLNFNKKTKQLLVVKEIDHPENKLRDINLTSDKPGHYKASNAGRASYTQPTDPKEIKIDNFTQEIANELEHGRNTNAYDKLIIVADPHVYGLLHQHITSHVQNLIVKTIEKNLMHLSNKELLDYLIHL